MKVLVTGANGFVGSRLLIRLSEAGHDITGSDQDQTEITDRNAVFDLMETTAPDAIIHLAAVSFVPEAQQDPKRTWQVNLEGTRNVIDALKKHASTARLIYVGTGDQYPTRAADAEPLTEEDPIEPLGPYSESKAAAEAQALEARSNGMDVVCVRPFNHTGPGQRPRFVAPEFARQIALIKHGHPIQMRVGNLQSTRDFLHVDDVIDAYIRLLGSESDEGLYNVASGVPTRIGELLSTLASIADVEIEPKRDEQLWRPTDGRVGDAGRLTRATGWQPQYSLHELLTDLFAYWERQIHSEMS